MYLFLKLYQLSTKTIIFNNFDTNIVLTGSNEKKTNHIYVCVFLEPIYLLTAS